MSKKRKKEPPVQEYKERYICRCNKVYRVKLKPTDYYAIHHGSFTSVQDAKDFVDERQRQLSMSKAEANRLRVIQ